MNWMNADEQLFEYAGKLTDQADTARYGRVTAGTSVFKNISGKIALTLIESNVLLAGVVALYYATQ